MPNLSQSFEQFCQILLMSEYPTGKTDPDYMLEAITKDFDRYIWAKH
jgi:hypothetical protein